MLHLLAPARKPRPTHTLTSTLFHLGAAGLFFLAILDSSPIPTFGGPDIATVALAASHRDLWYEYAATATAGSVIGAWFTFRLARRAGSAYLDRKFKQGRLKKFLTIFNRSITGTLAASTAIPLPTPTSMFFAAAGASDYPQSRFLIVVALSRAVRYFGLAFLAARYGRHILRFMRHPLQHWGWLVSALLLTIALMVGGIMLGRRPEPAPAK